mmetsp:Transcript_144761/g.360964  ORF Transcript_144761/g.360964 Transcript_144761/m.360964 type:complete len:207 (-) Transcript_144761:1867-2487(-)
MAVAVIDVHAALGLLPVHDDGVGISRHRPSTSSPPHLLEEDVPGLDVHRHALRVRVHGNCSLTCLRGQLRVPEIEPLPGRQVDVEPLGAGLRDRTDQDGLAYQEMVVGMLKRLLVVKAVVPQRPQNWQTRACPFGKECVPRRQELIPHSHLFPHHVRDLVAQHPRLPALCLQVGVPSVEWVPDPQLVPPPEELWLRIVEEAGHVRT